MTKIEFMIEEAVRVDADGLIISYEVPYRCGGETRHKTMDIITYAGYLEEQGLLKDVSSGTSKD